MKVARAIDVGFGNTKFTTSDGVDGDGIKCEMFPSVAPATMRKETKKFGDESNTVTIQDEGGMFYEVGPGSMDGMSSRNSRTLDTEFTRKPSYLALVRGAMHYMEVEKIDHLFVGLPVKGMEKASELEQKLTGVHQLPYRTVEVCKVTAVPQPVGGMFEYGIRNGEVRDMQNGINLLIDPGYFTLDWVVAKGMRMQIERSSSANNSGVGAILRAISKGLGEQIRLRDKRSVEFDEVILDRMDSAIRTGSDLFINGKKQSIENCIEFGNEVITNALNKLMASVENISDINRVIIVGGGAHLYSTAVSELFNGFDVRVAKDSAFSNVRGFQLMANAALHKAASKEMSVA